MNIVWQIQQLNCIPSVDGKQDYVVTAHWQCTGTDGAYSSYVYGTCGFAVVEGGTFIPYADLTQDDVLNWCWASGVDKAEVEANVTQQVQNLINPPIVTPPLPWVPAGA
jgi:hypothetical protein